MAEPQPSSVHEGMDNEDGPPPPPASGEDRKAAAAMSSLENRGNDEETNQKPNKAIDQDALGAAISRLELVDKAGKVGQAETEKKAKEKEEIAQRAKVKVDQADVSLLVDELDLTKAKATELLKAHEGDAFKAMKAFVTAPV